jgi:hypothetical protein
MMAMIPYPHVGRRQSIANPTFLPITQGDFLNAVHFIWNKFNYNNGVNLAGFRHNLRDYYDENIVMTQYEMQSIRGLLSDPEFQICVSPAGNSFRWDSRSTLAERKTVFIDEAIFFLFCHVQTEAQTNALRLIFLGTILHCLGDYITTWAQPQVDFSDHQHVGRFEGGMKTEYAFFGGIMGGQMLDGVHYDCARVRLFNSMNQSVHWIVPDQLARDYYLADLIYRFNEVNLTRNPVPMSPSNTIRQLDICCGWHRLVWKPAHRAPTYGQDPQQGVYATPYGTQQQQWGYQGAPGQVPNQAPPSYYGYPAAPGTTYVQQPQFPPPPATLGGSVPPPMGNLMSCVVNCRWRTTIWCTIRGIF